MRPSVQRPEPDLSRWLTAWAAHPARPQPGRLCKGNIMATTPRTPDDGRNERQRQRQEQDARREREPDDGRTRRQQIEAEKQDPAFFERMEEERKRPDFLERTRPEDPSDHFGQLTRDNVNPDIPSAEPGKGDIVDPRTLGMESIAGTAPPAPANQPEQWPSLGLDHTKDANDQV